MYHKEKNYFLIRSFIESGVGTGIYDLSNSSKTLLGLVWGASSFLYFGLESLWESIIKKGQSVMNVDDSLLIRDVVESRAIEIILPGPLAGISSGLLFFVYSTLS